MLRQDNRVIVLLAIAFAGLTSRVAAGPVSVTLSTPKSDYLAGEPVLLDVVVANTSPDPVSVWADDLKYYAIALMVAEGDNEFQRYHAFIYPALGIAQPHRELAPGATEVYNLRIVYGFARDKDSLTIPPFSLPGNYQIKTVYNGDPFVPPAAAAAERRIESNIVRITVSAPVGVDAHVWKLLQREENLLFLQTAAKENQDPNAPAVPRAPVWLTSFLTSHPHTSYHAAMRYVLAEYYGRMTRHDPDNLTAWEADTIRQVLNIEHPRGGEPFATQVVQGPFPEDYRLNVPIVYEFAKLTPYHEVFQYTYAVSGVPLYADATAGQAVLRPFYGARTLRERMLQSLQPGFRWVKRGDGYLLVSDKPEAE